MQDAAFRVALVLAALGWMAVTAGCKTDSLYATKEHDDAPVTDLENPAGVDLPPITVAGRTEVDLVEDLKYHRAMYARHLEVLARFYTEHGNEEKANWARRELRDLRLVKPYDYLDDIIVPTASLRPTESIAEADRLYQHALDLMKKGGHGVPALYNQNTMKLALAEFKDLVDRYPTSDKIDDAAFMIAEIHKEYFEEADNTIALRWYQRAIDWNPDLPYPARFQMAVIYHYRLDDREKALEMYQDVVEKERFNKSNLAWAQHEIEKLTREETRYARGEPIPDGRPEPVGSPEPEPGGREGGGEATVAGPAPAELP